MTRLAFYKNRYFIDIAGQEYVDIQNFQHFSKMYGPDVLFFDRTETIKGPIKMKNFFPLPKFRKFDKSYEDVTNDRAKEILKKMGELNCRVYLMYSGGIDSTLVLVSFLKNATKEQLNNITVLLSEDSIRENPVFYRNYVSKYFRMEPSGNLQYILGTKNILVSGELNDQVFGADIIGLFISKYGIEEVKKEYSREKILEFYNWKTGENMNNELFVSLIEKSIKNSPIKIVTNYDFFWWINFTTKWQCVYFRALAFASVKQRDNINEEYLSNYYLPFYGTEEFQLWSMNNLDKRIKEDWKSYKWPAKEVIFGFNKDEDYYKNKAKVASLPKASSEMSGINFIDEKVKFLNEVNLVDVYDKENDFK